MKMEKITKNLITILRAVAALFVLIAFLVLFASYPSTIGYSVWGVRNNGSVVDIDSGHEPYNMYNFFERMAELKDAGSKGTFYDIAIIILFAITFALLVLSVFYKPLRKMRYVVIPLILVVLCLCWIPPFYKSWCDLNNRYIVESYSGYTVYRSENISFEFNMMPSVCLAFVGFLFVFASNIVDKVISRKINEINEK